jgi:hypothetical protein
MDFRAEASASPRYGARIPDDRLLLRADISAVVMG